MSQRPAVVGWGSMIPRSVSRTALLGSACAEAVQPARFALNPPRDRPSERPHQMRNEVKYIESSVHYDGF
eukprot:5902487-Amphidinium_carterae.1